VLPKKNNFFSIIEKNKEVFEMAEASNVIFKWQNESFYGWIEKEYQNSFLINVTDPNEELETKYAKRIIISKKACERL
jgi:hypothetical protein